MGFFDKVKTFATGASMVTIELSDIERQPPATAQLPIGDSVVKGRYRIKAERDCTVLRHVAELRTRCLERDGTLGTLQAEAIYDVNHQVHGAPYQFPYELKAGQTMEAGFSIGGIDLRGALSRSYGVLGMQPNIECFLKVIIDVKGSPFDPEIEQVIRIVG